MANTLITIDAIAEVALAHLYETTVMGQLVYKDYSSEFVAGRGNTITVKEPAVFTARDFDRATGIVVQNATETGFPVVMDQLADVSFAVTSEEWTLDITDFDDQFITPACEAISQHVDTSLTGLRDDITQTVGAVAENPAGEDHNYANGRYPWSDSRVLIEAGAVLDRRSVPMGKRSVVVGPTIKSRWTAEKTWRQANKRGSTEGLMEASLGDRVSGFDPYMTQNIEQPAEVPTTGQPTTEVALAFHETAFALVTRPLALPRGARDARIVNYKGLGLRIVSDYNPNTKEDVISIDVLYGVKTLDPDRAVLIQGARAA